MSKKRMVLAYAILLELGVLIPQIKVYSYIGIIIINIFSILMNRNKIGIGLMSTFILGGEVFPIINFFSVILFGRGNIGIKLPQFKYVAVALFIFAFSLINSFFYGTAINCVFYICYLLIIFLCAAYCRNRVSEEDIIYSIKHFIVIQFIIVLTIAGVEQRVDPGDIFVGSLENAHWFGNWVLVNILAFYYINKYKYSLPCKTVVKKDWQVYLMALVEIYLADAKTLVVSMLVGIMIYKMSERIINKRNSFFYCFILFFLFLFVFSVIFQSDYVENFINGIVPGLAIYLYSDDFNGKMLYITGTFANELSGYRLFTGFGLGQYGSRIATLFAYDQVWRAENFVNSFVAATFDPAYIKDYVKYIRYYDYDLVNEIQWRSAVLTYPYNSITALIAETGIIGVISLGKYVNDVIKSSKCRFLTYYFMMACMFDIFFDDFPFVMLAIVMLFNTYENDLENTV